MQSAHCYALPGAAIVVTGLLPGGESNTAAYSVTSNVYCLILMPLLAQGITTAQRCPTAHVCASSRSYTRGLTMPGSARVHL